MNETAAPVGIKETTELLAGLSALSVFLVTQLKDGFQPGADLTALATQLITHPEFRQKIQDAVEGIGGVQGEVKELTIEEGFALAKLLIEDIKEIIAAASAAPAAPSA